MQFLYHKESLQPTITISGDEYRYLFKVRRIKTGSIVELRNMKDSNIYYYKVTTVDRKSATLELISSEEKSVQAKKELTLGWCIVDPKTVEKSLPMLNELGVAKIVFIKCAYSQANFKINAQRLEKILINSCQQCGRSTLMQFEFANSLNDFLQHYPQSYALDFSKNSMKEHLDINTIVIGCEGGFSEEERSLLKPTRVVGFESPLILRSESAAVATASLILL